MTRSHLTEPPSPDFAPIRMAEVEIGERLPRIEGGAGESGIPYQTAQCLIRLHGTPLGFVLAQLPIKGLEPQELADLIWRDLRGKIELHLEADGIPAPVQLEAAGLPTSGAPSCRAEMEEFLRRAPFASIVIPTRNRPDSVAKTVEKIASSNYPHDRYEVIVVDNGSGSDTIVELADVDPGGGVSVRVVHEAVPGSSNARNRGVEEANGEIVVFADDDVDVDVDWLATMVRSFDRDEQVGGVGGLTMPNELETPAQVWFEGFGSFMRGFERRVYDLANPPSDRPLFPFTVGDFGSGQNCACRRDVLKGLGGFDPTLGPGTLAYDGEDVEAMLRILLAGKKVVYEPAAMVRHEHQRDYAQFRRRVWGYGVGLTACLTKTLIENPRLLPRLTRKLPRGLAYALSPRSAKNENKQVDYPAKLSRLELWGMAYGPIAYARSRRHNRRRSRKTTRGPTESDPSPPAKLRALIVTDSHPPLIAGANRSVELLSRHLSALGHSVAVATAWQEGLPAFEEADGGVQVHRIRDLSSRMRWVSEDPYKHNPPPFPDPEAVVELRRLIRDFKPDLVHAYGWLAHSAAAALRAGEAPLLLSARDYGNICAVRTLVHKGREICDGPAPVKCLGCSTSFYGGAKGPVAAASVLGAGLLLRRRVTAIHSVSHFVAAQMDRHLHVPGAISTVIPNFHEDTSGKPVNAEILARLPQQPFILFVGAFRRIKGIEELLTAYRRLDAAPPLVLVGTRAPDTPEPFPPDGVTVIEDVPYPTVMAIWERALFGVLPSKAPETLGNVIHEAMSKGRAMIGTRPGGPEDMIEDRKSGLLVPAGDVDALAEAMALLIEDSDLRESIEKRARVRADEFTPEVVMPQLENLYYETIASFRERQLA
jgi:glycosyltransferase involved in cell wall biosynthesis/GT2 family glycosyltransferase